MHIIFASLFSRLKSPPKCQVRCFVSAWRYCSNKFVTDLRRKFPLVFRKIVNPETVNLKFRLRSTRTKNHSILSCLFEFQYIYLPDRYKITTGFFPSKLSKTLNQDAFTLCAETYLINNKTANKCLNVPHFRNRVENRQPKNRLDKDNR